ncbi:MAG TPA: hybrid sensor histidine kinase/response regulator [Candidatus Didemnitutus sp.]|nr:hybrid sensor histidine kinase/response regulator [Candidatus Didemnitutus sp.]
MPETILIVDDTPANLSVLVECLSDAGFNLMVAEDGEDALAQTERTQPDIILLDVMMPGLDGFETCRRLKARASTRDVPVLFMTALTDTAEKVKAFEAGAVDYVTKPIQHEEAIARINTHLTISRLRQQLQQQLALKENFMRIAGHDLRNPLCLILMSGDLARRKGASPEITGYLENIHDSARQMRSIIDTFLAVQKRGGTPGRVDLNLLATAIASQNEPAMERKELVLTMALAETLPPANADTGHAYQALTNYVSNAIKFLPRGGSLTIRTSASDMTVRVEVQDNGPGVPVAERSALFTEYANISTRPTAGEESTGLGLAIVKQLVESQRGAAGADFPASGGSVFWFELPVAPGA